MPAAAHRIDIAERPRRGGPALFLDRDGTLIEDPGYISRPQDVQLLPGVCEALRRFSDAGYALVIVTNQSGVARGLYGWSDYEAVAARTAEMFLDNGVRFDATFACGDAPGFPDPQGWRKPAPGMLLEAIRLFGFDPAASIMVGDKLADVEAADKAGIGRAVHVLTGQGEGERRQVLEWRGRLSPELIRSLADLAP